MSAETVTNKIEEKAKDSATQILEKAKEEARKTYDSILSEAHLREDKITSTANLNAEITTKGIIQSANQYSKLVVLGAKREVMYEVKQEAKKKLLASTDKSLIALFIKEMQNSDLSGDFTLFPSKIHRSLLENNLTDIVKSTGIKILVSKTDADIENGFVLSNDTYDVDFSIDAIIDEAFERNEKEIYDTLFEGVEE